MNRRGFCSLVAVGSTNIAGCLDKDVCDETSNHLHVENYLSEPQTVSVRVYRLNERIFADAGWGQKLSETIELPGERRLTLEQVYDTHGMYRTEAEHKERLEQNRSRIDDCKDQVVTIGIGDGVHYIGNGRPDELLPEAESDSTGSRW